MLTQANENVGEEGEVTGLLSGEHATIGGFGFIKGGNQWAPMAINKMPLISKQIEKEKGIAE